MMDDYTSIEGSHISLQPNNHHDQEWFERIELNQIPRNMCTHSIEIKSTKGCYIGENGKLPLEQTISRWLLKTDQYPNNPMMCPMNMVVLHSDVGHMMIPSSPRLYRIESIGWTIFIPDRSIPFILMMCEHGWRDYSANQQTSKIIQSDSIDISLFAAQPIGKNPRGKMVQKTWTSQGDQTAHTFHHDSNVWHHQQSRFISMSYHIIIEWSIQ